MSQRKHSRLWLAAVLVGCGASSLLLRTPEVGVAQIGPTGIGFSFALNSLTEVQILVTALTEPGIVEATANRLRISSIQDIRFMQLGTNLAPLAYYSGRLQFSHPRNQNLNFFYTHNTNLAEPQIPPDTVLSWMSTVNPTSPAASKTPLITDYKSYLFLCYALENYPSDLLALFPDYQITQLRVEASTGPTIPYRLHINFEHKKKSHSITRQLFAMALDLGPENFGPLGTNSP